MTRGRGLFVVLALAAFGCSQGLFERGLPKISDEQTRVLPRLTAEDVDPAAGYESPPAMFASELLPPEVRTSPHHRVRDEVATDGFFRIYHVESDFGAFDVAGDIAVRQRVQEVHALAALEALESDAEWRAARATAEADALVASARLVVEPSDSVEGVPEDTWQEVMRVAELAPDGRAPEEERLRRQVLDFESRKRRLARQLAVDPFSDLRELQRGLNRAAWTLAAGGYPLERIPSLAETSVAPVPEDLLPAARLAELYAHDSPEDLRRRSRIELAVMGVPSEKIEAFLAHPAYSPRTQTGIVEALLGLEPARDRGAYLDAALQARRPEDAWLYVFGGLILRYHHLQVSPVERLVQISERATAAVTRDGKLVLPGQVDYVVWSRPVDRIARAFAEARVPGVRAHELWVTGAVSPLARRELAERGITVVDGVLARLAPRLGK
jgi:hypothetical protein